MRERERERAVWSHTCVHATWREHITTKASMRVGSCILGHIMASNLRFQATPQGFTTYFPCWNPSQPYLQIIDKNHVFCCVHMYNEIFNLKEEKVSIFSYISCFCLLNKVLQSGFCVLHHGNNMYWQRQRVVIIIVFMMMPVLCFPTILRYVWLYM